jgi:hypothetical protein
MPGAAVKHISTAVWAPPGFLQWHEVALQWPKCTQCTAQHQQQAQQCMQQGTYCGGWRRCACLAAKTRVLAVGVLASTTCNNFIADLMFAVFERSVTLPPSRWGPLRTPLFIWGNGPWGRAARPGLWAVGKAQSTGFFYRTPNTTTPSPD